MSDELAGGAKTPEEELKQIEKHLESINPKTFEGIGKRKKDEILRTVTLSLIQEKSHSGPLPAPETLDYYNQIIPNGAERIMQMAENQQKHRHQLEAKVIPSQITQSKLGQIFGFILGLVGLGCGTFLAYVGQTYVGGIIAGATVVSLVSVFVIGKKIQKKDLEEK